LRDPFWNFTPSEIYLERLKLESSNSDFKLVKIGHVVVEIRSRTDRRHTYIRAHRNTALPYTRRDAVINGSRRGVVVSGVRRMTEVNPRRARLVTGWVTVFGWAYQLAM